MGNSRALIIPAKMLKALSITENSLLNVTEDGGRIVISKAGACRPVPVFPKVRVPELSEDKIETFLSSLYHVPVEDMENDERLGYILGK